MKNLTSDRWLIPIAFLIIYFVWGSTYLANWYAIQDIPPLLMSGARFVTAGGLLFALSFLISSSKPTLVQGRNAALIGMMFLAVGTGGMVWAEQFISSGMVALMASFQPLLVLLLMWQMRGKKPSTAGIIGTALGMTGMAFLVGQDQFISGEKTLLGIAVIFVSLVSWGFASVKVAQLNLPGNKLQSAGIQMLGGGGALLAVSLFTKEAFDFQWVNLTERGAWSWIYLVFFGSIVAFSAFNYLLIKSTPDKVATANYVNPVVAMFLGWWLNSEIVTGQSLIAALLMITGVVFINSRFSLLKKFSFKKHPASSLASLAINPDGSTKEVDIQLFNHPSLPPSGVIARIWHGMTTVENTSDYVAWTKAHCVQDAMATPGNLGVTFFHKTEGDVTHHTFISYWKDVDAIKRYAGEDYRKARVYSEEMEFLLKGDKEVELKALA
jgi:drug/metabolite transporter (DMT)-like permease/quinol monooxygenase YgiN